MTTLLDAPAAHAINPAERLRTTMAAVRVCFTWFGVRKALSSAQKAEAADTFGAEGSFLSAGKKLLDTSHAAFKAVTAVRSRVQQYWRALTLPYPEPGVRLMRRDDIPLFEQQLSQQRGELTHAVANLDQHFAELRQAARERLGRLYNPSDYPAALTGLFGVAWEYPNMEPPGYLRQLAPALYEAEARRVAARFEEAVQLAEQAFTEEFGKLVAHLTERLTGSDDGQPKVFRDSAVENLSDFFARFRRLNVRSSDELEQLVAQAQQIVRNVAPQELRGDQALRQRIAAQLSAVQSQVEGMLVDRPRRSILRRR